MGRSEPGRLAPARRLSRGDRVLSGAIERPSLASLVSESAEIHPEVSELSL